MNTAKLALYASHKLEGMVVDIGHDITRITCTYHRGWDCGFHSETRVYNVGGKELNNLSDDDRQYHMRYIAQTVCDLIVEKDEDEEVGDVLAGNIVLCGGSLGIPNVHSHLTLALRSKSLNMP